MKNRNILYVLVALVISLLPVWVSAANYQIKVNLPGNHTQSNNTPVAGTLVTWGYNMFGLSNPPAGNFVDAACAYWSCVAVASDGTLHTWGDSSEFTVANLPTGSDYTQVSCSSSVCVALHQDGSIQVWSLDSLYVSTAPTGAGFTSVDCGFACVALRSDGSLVVWGYDNFWQISNKPTDSGYVQTVCGSYICAARKADGTIVTWGTDNYGLLSNAPTGAGYKYVNCRYVTCYAIRADGSIYAWGYDGHWQVSHAPGGTGFVEVENGVSAGVARKIDGTLVSWGRGYEQGGVFSNLPTGLGYTKINCGYRACVALHP